MADDFDVDEKINEKMFDSVSIVLYEVKVFLLTRSMLRGRQDCTQEAFAHPANAYFRFILVSSSILTLNVELK